MNKTVSLIATSALALMVGCAPPVTTNVNTNTANTNTAVVTTNENVSTERTAENVNTNTSSRRDITREDFEKDKDRYTAEAKESGRKIGTGANDLWLWVKTRAALATVDDLRDSTVDVDVDNAIVTLSGNVPSTAQKTLAEKTAKGVEDIKSVKNMLKVAADNDNTNTANTNTATGKKGK
jgi:hypothetical protein